MTTDLSDSSIRDNVARYLSAAATQRPDAVAIVEPASGPLRRGAGYRQWTFRELEEDSNRIATGLAALGLPRGARVVLMVPPGFDFTSCVYGLLKGGFVAVLIDPGMGRRNLLQCLAESEPEALIGIPLAHAVRAVLRHRFPALRRLVTVGRRWFWGGHTLDQVRRMGTPRAEWPASSPEDPAAIIFTTGSTGPPKGVLYHHRTFCGQVETLRAYYAIRPGDVDVPGFPLFALFNSAMGVTTVIPDMDPTRPADVDPTRIIQAARDWNATQAFGSPAMWNTVGRYCERHGEGLPTLRRVFSAGAPVPPHVLSRLRRAIHDQGEIYTPYGATEALPVASISAAEVLGETAARTREGAGYCVGRRMECIDWRIIEIDDGPIARLEDVRILPAGQIGELIVRGPVVTTEYVTRRDANALHKIRSAEGIWHRMGDVGYFDDRQRFWFCGRKAHRVQTASGVLFTVPCEAIFNQHPSIYRSALVGIGPAGAQRPVIVAEPWPEAWPNSRSAARQLVDELRQLAAACPSTQIIRDVLLKRSLPVDIRHNAKIFREKLAPWAARQLARTVGPA